MLRYNDILATRRNPSKISASVMHELHKSPTVVASSDAMRICCEARTYQNKMETIRSDNMKADDMKIVFNCSAGLEGKNKRLKQWPVVVTNRIKTISNYDGPPGQ